MLMLKEIKQMTSCKTTCSCKNNVYTMRGSFRYLKLSEMYLFWYQTCKHLIEYQSLNVSIRAYFPK